MAHLIVDRQLGCYAEYYVTVDGVLYEPLQRRAAAVIKQPASAAHPDSARRVPAARRKSSLAGCFGGVYEYIRFRLPVGAQVLAVSRGCAQGTEVPQTSSAPVHFTVTG